MKHFSLVSICLIGLAEAGSALLRANLRRGTPAPTTDRENSCRFCFRKCPINCFVGTCGLEAGFTTKRYMTTMSCWTCDASASVGINKEGDFDLCTADESAATASYIPAIRDAGPIGPAQPGDATASSAAASVAALAASAAARTAAYKAGEVIQAVADAKAQNEKDAANATANANNDVEAVAAVAQIKAQEALKRAQAATAARNIAEQHYNIELKKLRKEQLLTGRAEEILLRAEKANKDADKAKAIMVKRASQAAKDASVIGAEAAGQAAEAAQSDEMASAAKAAQRRAIMAAREAKDAADKVNAALIIANRPDYPLPTLPPCNPTTALLQAKGAQPQACSMLPEAAIDAEVEKMAGLPAGVMNDPAPGEIPEFLRNMPAEYSDKRQPVDDGAMDSVSQGGPHPLELGGGPQDGVTPGMLSTVQLGSRMHKGTSRKI